MFSVVIPAYNCEKTISRVLESVVYQTKKSLIEEIIIVNDGSSDNTERMILGFIDNHPEWSVRLINQVNTGVSAARNRGIREAKAEWIALLDSDDVWIKNKIERQSEIIKNNKNMVFLGISYPLKIYFKTYYSGLYNLTAKQLCFRYTPCPSGVVFRRDVGLQLGLFDESMHYCEDINFFQKFFRYDSYYILAEDLIRIAIGRKYHAQSGLSSNLKEMHKGRRTNTYQLYDCGLINKRFMIGMLILNELKYVRRVVLVLFSSFLNKVMRF